VSDGSLIADALRRQMVEREQPRENGDSLDETIPLRVSSADKHAWKRHAKQHQTTVSQLIRDSVNAEVRRARAGA
jgi:hypothetical protein